MAIKKKSTKQKKIKKTAGKKKSSKKKAPPKKAAVRSKSGAKAKKTPARKPAAAHKTRVRGKNEDASVAELTPKGMGARSGGQSGSLQGLSDIEGADSESVDELIEEGNAFEAEVVKGVEDAPDPDEEEVHTHELPEDDIPGEYEDQ